MKHTLQQRTFGLSRACAIITAVVFLFGTVAETAIAASSWDPTLLVNTESFQVIDEGDGTTDIEIRFGGTLNQKLIYERTNGRFKFTNDLRVLGDITATGSVNIGNAAINLAATGSVFNEHGADADFRIEGDTNQNLFFIDASADRVGIGTSAPKAFLDVVGSVSGASLTVTNLKSCNTIDTDVNGNLVCGVDNAAGTGLSLSTADDRYVNTSGDTMTGKLTINLTTGSLGLDVKQVFSGNTLRVSNNAAIHGPLAVSGAIRTDGNLTINDDQTAADAILTFGNATNNQFLTFLNTLQIFQFSKGLSVLGNLSGSTLRVDGAADIHGPLSVSGAIRTEGSISGASLFINGASIIRGTLASSGSIRTEGNLSGSTLTVDGNVTFHGVTYSYPTTQGGSGQVLKNNGAGVLTWSDNTGPNGSGNILFMQPQYPNALYFGSGSNKIGTLNYLFDSTNTKNHYRWQTTKTTNQQYWVSTRVRVPNNFSSWDPVRPLQFEYRSSGAYLDVRMLDTNDAIVPLTGGSTLSNASWTTASITGPNASGTFTKDDYFTIFVKMTASGATSNNTKFADASFLEINWETLDQ